MLLGLYYNNLIINKCKIVSYLYFTNFKCMQFYIK